MPADRQGGRALRGTWVLATWELVGLAIVVLEAARLATDGPGGSIAGLVGGLGILGLALWEHLANGGQEMARASRNPLWLLVTVTVALIMGLVVVRSVQAFLG